MTNGLTRPGVSKLMTIHNGSVWRGVNIYSVKPFRELIAEEKRKSVIVQGKIL
jgi:hypothetical protein